MQTHPMLLVILRIKTAVYFDCVLPESENSHRFSQLCSASRTLIESPRGETTFGSELRKHL